MAGCDRCFQGNAAEVWQKTRELEVVESLVDESHFSVRLRRCSACGQRFVTVFCETVDWSGGNDPQGFLVVPISAEEAESLRGLDENATERAVLGLTPKRRCLDAWFPSDGRRLFDWQEGPILLAPHE